MTIHTYSFTTPFLRGDHATLTEMVRQIAATHFNECVEHFDDFISISIDYDAVQDTDGNVISTTTSAIVEYDDEWWLDDEDDSDDDGFAGALVPRIPSPTSPTEAAEVDPLNYPFFTVTAFATVS